MQSGPGPGGSPPAPHPWYPQPGTPSDPGQSTAPGPPVRTGWPEPRGGCWPACASPAFPCPDRLSRPRRRGCGRRPGTRGAPAAGRTRRSGLPPPGSAGRWSQRPPCSPRPAPRSCPPPCGPPASRRSRSGAAPPAPGSGPPGGGTGHSETARASYSALSFIIAYIRSISGQPARNWSICSTPPGVRR